VIPWTQYLAGNPRYHDPAQVLRTAQQLSAQTVGKARVEGTLAGAYARDAMQDAQHEVINFADRRGV
jgi:hypothetical protein